MHKKNVIAIRSVAKILVAVSSVYISQAVLAEEPAKPSWNISGWVNESMSYYDDGEGSDMVQLSDNGTTLGSRITFSGSTVLTTGLNAGFDVTIEPFSGNPNFTGAGNQITPLVFSNQDNLDSFNGGDIGLLGTSVYFGGDWGKLTVGLQSMPTDNIGVMADPSMTLWSGVGAMFRGSGFFLRGSEGTVLEDADKRGGTWGSFIQCLSAPGLGIGIDCNGIYRNGIRYDLPVFGPVSFAVGYANDDIYDIAMKYSDKIAGLDVKFHVGYAYNADGAFNLRRDTTPGAKADTDSKMFTTQLGLMDPETGLFGAFTWQHEKASGDLGVNAEDETDAYYTKIGMRKAWNKLGDTAFYVEYGQYNDQFGGLGALGVTGSEVTRTGAAIEQYFGSKLIVYAKYEQLDLDVDGSTSVEAIYDDIDKLNLLSLGVTYFY